MHVKEGCRRIPNCTYLFLSYVKCMSCQAMYTAALAVISISAGATVLLEPLVAL